MERTTGVTPPPIDSPVCLDKTGVELKRGAFFNTVAMLASNVRAIFPLLIARLLGPAALGTFSIAWSITDVISKIAVFGLDNAITTFIARSEAVGDRARSRTLFRLAVNLALLQSIGLALIVSIVALLFGTYLRVPREVVPALVVLLSALPGIALYRICTSVSRGMKVMHHDIYSRGITDSVATTVAFLIAFGVGATKFAPEVAAIVGAVASGVVALVFASKLFRDVSAKAGHVSLRTEARQLLFFAAPVSACQLLDTFITELDVIMLGSFIGRAPGVTLGTIGIYSAAVGIAVGLRKINQAFNPIFAPLVAGMTALGDNQRAAATHARLAQWMLWILLPLVAVMALAGDPIMMIYGSTFRMGGTWLGILAVGLATNAFVTLGETAIMVQQPRLNLINSSVAAAVAVGANVWLIPRFGVTGAAIGVLLPFAVQGVLRYAALKLIFRWQNPWTNISPPIIAAAVAIVPALICRGLLRGLLGQILAAAVFLAVFGLGWMYHLQFRRRLDFEQSRL